jgi:hypothetical protein
MTSFIGQPVSDDMDCVCNEWQKNLASGMFADWYYLRTGDKATSLVGEIARQQFLEGKLIRIDSGKGKPKVSYHKF